ncbi:hypothetical protein LR48_Vigan641s004300 [Vigna angularis]|uniref:Uncharacterized protein n=1 Tax=Phaseolus angularis TaxID=3914 RepID=A0A0L9TF63_PHAAN|nr:UDP-glycosyltransferase 73C6 [Vigna angularis]KOM29255.1 hypothetical protein LR48_Vigan641s004300 [Vigna angularis]
MDSQTHQQHSVLVPLMSQSHLLPFTQKVKLLAVNGVSVTIFLTPLNAAKLNNVIDQAKALNLQIQFHLLHFPSKEAGLQEGRENTDTLPSPQYQYLFFAASNKLKEPSRNGFQSWKHYPLACFRLLRTLESSKAVQDSIAYVVESKFKIPRVVFHGISCFALLCSHNITKSKVHENVTSMSVIRGAGLP